MRRRLAFLAGATALAVDMRETDENGAEHKSFLALPTLRLERDRTIVVDARKGHPVRVSVPDETAMASTISVGHARSVLDGDAVLRLEYYTARTFDGIYTGQLGSPIDADDFVGVISAGFDTGKVNSPDCRCFAGDITRRRPNRAYHAADRST